MSEFKWHQFVISFFVVVALSVGMFFSPIMVANATNEQRVAAAMEQCPPLPVAPGKILESPVTGTRAVVVAVGRDAMVGRWDPCREAVAIRTEDVDYLTLTHAEAEAWISATKN